MNSGRAVLFDIGHPAHVHVFKNVIRLLQDRGVSVHVTARRKEVSLHLLDAYRIPYTEVGRHRADLSGKAVNAVARVRGILRALRQERVRAAMGVHNPYVALAGAMAGVSTGILVDSEPVRYDRYLTYPFAKYLLTPRGFSNDLGKKQVRFDGFKELAYLHPNYFTPDIRVLDELGISARDRYFLVRFVAWAAEHDIGQGGLSVEQKRRLVRELESYGRVLISSEAPLPSDLRHYVCPLAPQRIHDVLAYASLLVSESQTMTTEAALLGTPVVQTNTLVGTMSNFAELEGRYGLIRAERDGDRALVIAETIAADPLAKREALEKRTRLLNEKIDVAAYLAQVAIHLLEGRRPSEGRKAR